MSQWHVSLKRLDKNRSQKTDREFVKQAISSVLGNPTAAYQDLIGKIFENNGTVIQFTACRPIFAG